MNTCPWCAEEVKPTAIKCPHCCSSLAPAAAGPADRVVLDRRFYHYAQFSLALLAFFAVIGAAFFGVQLNNAKQELFSVQFEAQKALIEAQKAQNESQRASNEASRWLDSVRPGVEKIQSDLKQLQSDTEVFLTNLRLSSEGVQGNTDALEKRIVVLEQRQSIDQVKQISDELQKQLENNLRVRQSSAEVAASGPQGNRPNFDISFVVCVQNNDQCDSTGLDAVDKVVYRLNPRWFSLPSETRVDRSNQFKFGIRVWGSTTVTACIYLKGGIHPIVRSGSISLAVNVPDWGRDPLRTQENCEK